MHGRVDDHDDHDDHDLVLTKKSKDHHHPPCHPHQDHHQPPCHPHQDLHHPPDPGPDQDEVKSSFSDVELSIELIPLL